MATFTVPHIKIEAISSAVPEKEARLTNDPTLYGGNEKQLKRVMKSSGFDKRRLADDKTTTADLCVAAAQTLFDAHIITPEEPDALIFVSQTPDYQIPATSCILQKRLDLREDIAVFDINHGCSGYVYGLYLAASLINSGCKTVLLLVGDTVSKFTDMFKNGSAPIFGDAGTATVVRYDENAVPMFFDIGTDGGGADAIMAKNGGFRNPPKPEMFYEDGTFKYDSVMDGMRIMQFTLDKVPASIEKLLTFAGKNKEDVSSFVLHQANKLILQNIAMSLDIPFEKMPMETLSKYGNQSSASIPTAVCDVLREQVEKTRADYVFCGFGIGLTWASCFLKLDHIFCPEIKIYKGEN